MKEQLYHVYFDQGGWIGMPKLVTSNEPMQVTGEVSDTHISHYYFGQMTKYGILTMVTGFNVAYPRTPVIKIEGDLEIPIVTQMSAEDLRLVLAETEEQYEIAKDSTNPAVRSHAGLLSIKISSYKAILKGLE